MVLACATFPNSPLPTHRATATSTLDIAASGDARKSAHASYPIRFSSDTLGHDRKVQMPDQNQSQDPLGQRANNTAGLCK